MEMRCMFKAQSLIYGVKIRYQYDLKRYFQNKNYFIEDKIKQTFRNKLK